MKRWNTDKKIWAYIFGIAVLVVVVQNLSTVVGWIQVLWNACQVFVLGGMLAYVVNLIMVRFEKILPKNRFGKTLSLLFSFLVVIIIVYILMNLVVPSLIEAFQVLFTVLPEYFDKLQKLLIDLFENNPQFVDAVNSVNINWDTVSQKVMGALTSGVGSVLDKTFSIVNVVVNVVVNGILAIIFAIYVLSEKERFISLYHRITDLWMKPSHKEELTTALRIVNQTFGSFIGGQCIEATILGTMCAVGMSIMHMPYPLMIGTLVGAINIIPMIGAYIGGAIGVFMVFTVNPFMSLIFLIYLCIIQQIESNVIYPRVVGKSVGLPGIYVMITVVVGGSLAGVAGMFLGIPLVASIYKICRIYFHRAEENRRRKLEANKTIESV